MEIVRSTDSLVRWMEAAVSSLNALVCFGDWPVGYLGSISLYSDSPTCIYQKTIDSDECLDDSLKPAILAFIRFDP